ncbi:MAG: (d)CMP kinase [Cardiobacteriaceae bacterium]|nr:(d)CMP kinase [Cardiobacteriaceae bacterium]
MRTIITLDGPGGVGKGTVAKLLAEKYNLQHLDSGAVYRLCALHLQDCLLFDASELEQVAEVFKMKFEFKNGKFFSAGVEIPEERLRSEFTAQAASQIAVKPKIRAALLQWQRNYGGEENLVADGRDMGTVVFPDAQLKFFLDADAKIRAKRRFEQLKKQGENVSLAALEREISERDKRDRNRETAPLKPAADAVVIDTTELSVKAVLDKVVERCQVFFN